ncbi:DUF421 domain-containing protein [Streptomyces sp. PSKA54]|uniref:DUF421 domain-containing protein n=1 Tax=Streptomyces himalayensis subsp. aureolus TaxID=2758039 RepID=A0A7W2HGA7_9ACTN|nr:YetF domain-containing protein [Streptomyces himalayensis]MBA4862785.1 DUF421 domain-containing protein [Streptomyces himalayensis subsp. aureolus]
METILRALMIYLVLMLLLRIAGKRTLADMTTFDVVLVLVISEATQQALLGDDFSLTTSALAIATLIGIDRLADYLGYRFPTFSKITNSTPVIIMDDGKLLRHRMKRLHVNEFDILEAARESHGLARLDQIRYAVLETSGGISVIPRQ